MSETPPSDPFRERAEQILEEARERGNRTARRIRRLTGVPVEVDDEPCQDGPAGPRRPAAPPQ